MLYELLYRSLATHPMSGAELARLLEEARQKNKASGVTGLLVYHERCFMQVLEGERETVEALYSKIAKDPRHQSVDIVWDGAIEERSFQRWAMGFRKLDALDPSRLAGFSAFLESGFGAEAVADHRSEAQELMLLLRDGPDLDP